MESKERLISDSLTWGICTAVAMIISIFDIIGIRSNFLGEFCSDFGLSVPTGVAGIVIFGLALGYVIAAFITGFKLIFMFFIDTYEEENILYLLLGLLIAFLCGHIVGLVLLPIRIIVNIIRVIVELIRGY